MQLSFELGDPTRPRGHALVYFRGPRDTVLATYVVVPPIPIEFGKFLPSMFAAHMPSLALPQNAAMPLPPLLEPMASQAALERLARSREDDLVCGGALSSDGPEHLLQAAAEAAQAYAEVYAAHAASEPTEDLEPSRSLPELDTEDILLQLMSDRDRLSELAKRTGQLRYAAEGGDESGIAEAIQAMERVNRYLAPKYRCAELIVVARESGAASQRLADLYLQRAFKLAAEEFDALPALDAAIEAARGEAAPSGEDAPSA
jgi:hypothetical protein